MFYTSRKTPVYAVGCFKDDLNSRRVPIFLGSRKDLYYRYWFIYFYKQSSKQITSSFRADHQEKPFLACHFHKLSVISTDTIRMWRLLWFLRFKLSQGYITTIERQFTFYCLASKNLWYSFYQTRKDEWLSQLRSHPVVLSLGSLNWESSALTNKPDIKNFSCSL